MRRAAAKHVPKANRVVSVLLVDTAEGGSVAESHALADRGFKIARARTLPRALTALRAARHDAVLLDVGDDQDEALVALARIEHVRPQLPVVLLCEGCKVELAMCGFEMGAVDVLQKPVEVDHLANRIRSLIATRAKAPREKTIAELMVPASAYRRVYEDEPVRHVIAVLAEALFHTEPGKFTENAHRSVLVYSRKGAFLGCLRINDVLAALAPPSSRETSAPAEAGMLMARCKLLGRMTAGDLLGEQHFVDIDAPLMEAVQLMVFDGLINIPVLDDGDVAGVLTDRNVLLEISNLAADGS